MWYYATALELSHGALTTLFIHSKPLDYPEHWEEFEETELVRLKKIHGDIRYQLRRKGKLHCHFGPALEFADGTKKWYRKGQIHRANGPAVEQGDGTKKWYHKGKLHRKYDEPAVVRANGLKEWYRHGERHRKDYPAIKCPHGCREWYTRGEQVDVGEVFPDACFAELIRGRFGVYYSGDLYDE